MKIVLKPKEASDSISKTTVYDNVVKPSADQKGTRVDVSQETNVAVGTDPAHSKPEGVWTTTQPDITPPLPHEECGCEPGFHKLPDGTCAPDEEEKKEGVVGTPLVIGTGDQPQLIQKGDPMPEVDNDIGPDSTNAPRALPRASDTRIPLQHWGDGKGEWTPKDNTPVSKQPLPHEQLPTLEERRARIHAELQAKDSEAKAIAWEQKHNEIYEKYTGLNAQYNEQKQQFDTLRGDINREREQTNNRVEALIAQAETYKLQYNNAAGDNLKLKNDLAKTQEQALDWHNKYDAANKRALDASVSATQANEDYLVIAKKLDEAKEALERSKIEAKKIIRIKA